MSHLNSASFVKNEIEALVDQKINRETTDLTNCDREPIHIPNCIQPHGYLIVFEPNTLKIVQVSQNISVILNQSADSILSTSLKSIFSKLSLQSIEASLSAANGPSKTPLELQFHPNTRAAKQRFTGFLHPQDKRIILELEPLDLETAQTEVQFYQTLNITTEHLQQTQTLTELCQASVDEIRQLTGFDRVMVYQFSSDGSGTVVAEAVDHDRASYLGLRYPATDIPQQAKYLYTLNWLRMIPKVDYDPVPILSTSAYQTAPPIDMSAMGLRSISPMHIEYLQNMGVQASMSISLMHQGQLWGLIACHHDQPKIINIAQRTACELIGKILSSELSSKEQWETLESLRQQKLVLGTLRELLLACDSLSTGLIQSPQLLLDLVHAQGIAYIENNQITLFGQTPTAQEVQEILPCFESALGQNSIYSTSMLTSLCPTAEAFESKTCGLLGLSISRSQHIYLLWFRPEQIQFVTWAGNPNKPKEIDQTGQVYLTPRQSFERWQETIYLQSTPWLTDEIEAALELRSAIIEVVLQKADELAQINLELSRSNDDLASFASVASHDLKAPLRAIANLASWLQDDLEGKIPTDNQTQLDLLQSRVYRMQDMINGLLNYARVSQDTEESFEVILFPNILNEIIDTLSPPTEFKILLPERPLSIKTHKTLLKQVLMNLLSNGIKYMNRADGEIEIAITEQTETFLFEIKDNGPGIEPRYYDKIFQMFQTLPSQNGVEGTGMGLAIVQRVVQKVGGKVWVAPNQGTGCIFSFTWPR